MMNGSSLACRLLYPVVASLLNGLGKLGAAGLHYPALVEHVDHVGAYHLEQTVVVGYHDARVVWRAQLVHALGNYPHGIDIKPGVGLVEYGELRFEHCHLEYLVALLLAAAETLVHAAVGELRIELHYLLLLAQQLQKLGCFHLGKALSLALLVDGGFHEVGHRHSSYLDRILEREEKSLVRTLLGLHREQVLAVEAGLALSDLIEWIAGEHSRKGRLARTVGAHNGMGLTRSNAEIDAPEYLFASYGGMKIAYF